MHQILITEDGSYSVKVTSCSQILAGDKVCTMHGQKVIARIVTQHKLPVIVTEDRQRFYAHIYIAVGSIVSRQTNSHIYDSSHGLRAARAGQLDVEGSDVNTQSESFKYLKRPQKGNILARLVANGKMELVRGTIGISWVTNQTQMTRERQYLTYRPEGKYSIGTRSGRANRGGVSVGEMDFHAMFGSGRDACA